MGTVTLNVRGWVGLSKNRVKRLLRPIKKQTWVVSSLGMLPCFVSVCYRWVGTQLMVETRVQSPGCHVHCSNVGKVRAGNCKGG